MSDILPQVKHYRRRIKCLELDYLIDLVPRPVFPKQGFEVPWYTWGAHKLTIIVMESWGF